MTSRRLFSNVLALIIVAEDHLVLHNAQSQPVRKQFD